LAERLYRISVQGAPWLVWLLMHLWFATCRTRCTGRVRALHLLKRGPVIACFWHYSIFYTLYHLRRHPAAVMVSASRDGEYLARLAGRFGYRTVRGSGNRFGTKALLKLIRLMRSGCNAGLVGDGSQGPPRLLQKGVVLLASRSGAPVIPFAWSASRFIRFSSWDRTIIPLPFCRIHVVYGEPYYVEPDLDARGLARHCRCLEERMNRVYRRAWNQVGRVDHEGGSKGAGR